MASGYDLNFQHSTPRKTFLGQIGSIGRRQQKQQNENKRRLISSSEIKETTCSQYCNDLGNRHMICHGCEFKFCLQCIKL